MTRHRAIKEETIAVNRDLVKIMHADLTFDIRFEFIAKIFLNYYFDFLKLNNLKV